MDSSSHTSFQIPFPESYWVVSGKLMAGEYPGKYDEELTRKRIISLLRCGLNSFVDLTRPADSFHPYHEVLVAEAADFGLEVKWQNFPIVDFSTPSPELMGHILDEIDAQIKAGMSVYVHCLAGIGRTGMVVGCYLVRHGLTGQQALQQLNALRKDTPSWWQRSPESQEQVEFILNWQDGAKPGAGE